MLGKTSILIADDHPIVRQGLRQTIERESDLKVVAEAADGLSALEQIQGRKPGIAILDIEMPELDGIGVMREINRRSLAVKVIVLTIYRDEEAFEQSIDLGAKGYVLKDSAVIDIVSAIRAVAAGHNYFSPAMTDYLVGRRNRAAALARQGPSLHDLTPAERNVLKLIAEYKTSTEIAEALHISPRTVETHRTNICGKLEIRGRHALMKFALTHKYDVFL
jgi:DNA-binding NarL/FixJ family response regulator